MSEEGPLHIVVETASDCVRLHLAGEATIYAVHALHGALHEALGAAGLIEIDLARVTELDTAALQQLCLAKRTASAAGKRMSIVAHSAATSEVIDLLGMVAYFGDPLLVPAAAHGAAASADSARRA